MKYVVKIRCAGQSNLGRTDLKSKKILNGFLKQHRTSFPEGLRKATNKRKKGGKRERRHKKNPPQTHGQNLSAQMIVKLYRFVYRQRKHLRSSAAETTHKNKFCCFKRNHLQRSRWCSENFLKLMMLTCQQNFLLMDNVLQQKQPYKQQTKTNKYTSKK